MIQGNINSQVMFIQYANKVNIVNQVFIRKTIKNNPSLQQHLRFLETGIKAA